MNGRDERDEMGFPAWIFVPVKEKPVPVSPLRDLLIGAIGGLVMYAAGVGFMWVWERLAR